MASDQKQPRINSSTGNHLQSPGVTCSRQTNIAITSDHLQSFVVSWSHLQSHSDHRAVICNRFQWAAIAFCRLVDGFSHLKSIVCHVFLTVSDMNATTLRPERYNLKNYAAIRHGRYKNPAALNHAALTHKRYKNHAALRHKRYKNHAALRHERQGTAM